MTASTGPLTSAPHYTDERVTLYHGDSLDVLAELPAASVDAVVTDPPYGLADLTPAMVARAVAAWFAGDRDHVPDSRGFMGRAWDGFVPPPGLWDECLRVLKPGGHLLAFSAPRTQDLMGLSIRLAGFEIRDSVTWVFASGFPKSLDVSKAIDRRRTEDLAPAAAVAAWLVERMAECGVTRRILDEHFGTANIAQQWTTPRLDGVVKPRVPRWEQWERLRLLLGFGPEMDAEVWRLNGRKGTPGEAFEQRPLLAEEYRRVRGGTWSEDATGMFRTGEKTVRHTAPATAAAGDWEGWGTALKPATEPIVVARKPLAGTVAGNVLSHGTGALNIDACRVAHANPADRAESEGKNRHADFGSGPRDNQVYGADGRDRGEGGNYDGAAGRWPSNLVLTHAPGCQLAGSAVLRGDPRPGGDGTRAGGFGDVRGATDGNGRPAGRLYGDETVPVFDCADGCPVAELDAQSGTTVSSDRLRNNAVSIGGKGAYSGGGEAITGGYGDAGGASRFFPVFGYDEDEKARAGCVEGCPVAELDAQSGDRPGMTRSVLRRGATTGRSIGGSSAYGTAEPQDTVAGYDDSGGASRFFPVFGYDEDEKGCVEGCPVAELDQQSGITVSSDRPRQNTAAAHNRTASMGASAADWTTGGHADSGGASRFFPVFRYEPKAGAGERPRVSGAAHPTVKPLALMRWLVRLVTPPGGIVLEPFAGSGTTVEACLREGFRCVAVERDESYLPLIDERIRRSLRPWQPPVDQAERVAAGEAQPSLFDDLGE